MKQIFWLLIGCILLSCNSAKDSLKQDEKVNIDSLNKVVAPKETDSSSVSFQKDLTLQGISYHIISKGVGSIQKLSVTPAGLTMRIAIIEVDTDPVVGAEIEDLDRDGFPELLVYTQSAGSGSFGNVIGFSPNKGKSLSQIYFPPLKQNSAVTKGYRGHDEFAIVESTLMRRFKTFEGDSLTSKATGKIRQIAYKLTNGEASKKFVMGKIIEIVVP